MNDVKDELDKLMQRHNITTFTYCSNGKVEIKIDGGILCFKNWDEMVSYHKVKVGTVVSFEDSGYLYIGTVVDFEHYAGERMVWIRTWMKDGIVMGRVVEYRRRIGEIKVVYSHD